MAIFTDNEYTEYDSNYNEYEDDDNDDNEEEEDDNEDDDNDEEEYDEEDDLIIYEGNETSGTRFNLILCEIYNNKKHGLNNINDTYYLTLIRIKSIYNFEGMTLFANYFNKLYKKHSNKLIPHSHIKNYENIITGPNYIKPEIAECIVLQSGHNVSIIKTIWIRLIQRTWKRIYKEREQIIQKRATYASIKEREITGYWPKCLRVLPRMNGMMNYLV
jgi:hypothetical protein